MGYALVFGHCCNCSQFMGFNPIRVPSVRINGKREPVCRTCVETLNAKRKLVGAEPWPIPPDAYEPVDENEI